MAVFSNTIITKKGHALVAKGMSGEQINFTKVRTSNYDYPSSTNFENLTVLGSIKQTVDISAVNIGNESTVRVKAAILNTDLTSGYYVKNIGLYANDPDEGEILFSITTATTADFIPAYNGVNTSVLTVDLLTTVSNSGNVNLTVSPGGLVTTEMIATETTAGIISIEEILKYQSVSLGLTYGGKFGKELKEGKEGKFYYLKDDENYKAYLCISNTSNTAGILIPDSNFIEYGLFQYGRRADIFFSGRIDLPNTFTPIATINPIKAKYLVVVYTFVPIQYEITSIVPIDAIDTVQLHFHDRLSGVDEGITLYYNKMNKSLNALKKANVGTITYLGIMY